jgi:hypothetical protein
MEKEWHLATKVLRKINPVLVTMFGFDNVEEDINIVCNGLTKKNFPKKDVWTSQNARWVRAGLVVWDYLQKSSVEENQVFAMTRDVGDWRLVLMCKVVEVHLQTRDELSGLMFSDVQQFSKVCGRAVLAIEKIEIFKVESAEKVI